MSYALTKEFSQRVWSSEGIVLGVWEGFTPLFLTVHRAGWEDFTPLFQTVHRAGPAGHPTHVI